MRRSIAIHTLWHGDMCIWRARVEEVCNFFEVFASDYMNEMTTIATFNPAAMIVSFNG
jgi:hypothetical protein